MAAGKNAVSDILKKELGFVHLDADRLIHTIIDKKDIAERIKETFAEDALKESIVLENEDGSINRRNLGKLIFKSPSLVKKQEDIVYPELIELTKEFIRENANKNIVLNATVLYKTPPLLELVDKVLFVDAPLFVRFFRAKKRDGMRFEQILQRFKAQKNLFSKYAQYCADIVRVWNIGSRNCLEKKIQASISTQ